MQRLTCEKDKEYQLKEGIEIDAAVIKLAKFEDMYEALVQEKEKIVAQLEEMKGSGKSKTVTYNQFLANKLMLVNLINRFDIYS